MYSLGITGVIRGTLLSYSVVANVLSLLPSLTRDTSFQNLKGGQRYMYRGFAVVIFARNYDV